MNANITTLYCMIMLPISLGYIQMKKEDTGKIDIFPVILLLFFLASMYFTRDTNRWALIVFKVRSWF